MVADRSLLCQSPVPLPSPASRARAGMGLAPIAALIWALNWLCASERSRCGAVLRTRTSLPILAAAAAAAAAARLQACLIGTVWRACRNEVAPG